MEEEDGARPIEQDDGNVWATSGSRGKRKGAAKKHKAQRDQKHAAAVASVSERIKSLERMSAGKKQGGEEAAKGNVVSVSEFRNRLLSNEENKQTSNNINNSVGNKNNTSAAKVPSKTSAPSPPNKQTKSPSIDFANLRQLIRAKELAVVSSQPPRGTSPSASQSPESVSSSSLSSTKKVIPFSNDMMHSNIHERRDKDTRVKSMTRKPSHSDDGRISGDSQSSIVSSSSSKSFIPFSNDMMHSNVHERKNLKDMTRTLIRRLSLEQQEDMSKDKTKAKPGASPPSTTTTTTSTKSTPSPVKIKPAVPLSTHSQPQANSTPNSSVPPPPPPPPFLRDISSGNPMAGLKSRAPPKTETPVTTNNTNTTTPVPATTVTVTSTGSRSNRDKNNSFFNKKKNSRAEELQQEQERLNKMTPQERLKEQQEKEESAQHDKKKSDHYAKIGKAFVVKDAGCGMRISGGRGGGRGGGGRGR